VIERPIDYRPFGPYILHLIPLALFAAPVPVYILTQSWLFVLLVAVVTWPSGILAIVLFRHGGEVEPTGELRADNEM
jgi:hypothetical protein